MLSFIPALVFSRWHAKRRDCPLEGIREPPLVIQSSDVRRITALRLPSLDQVRRGEASRCDSGCPGGNSSGVDSVVLARCRQRWALMTRGIPLFRPAVDRDGNGDVRYAARFLVAVGIACSVAFLSHPAVSSADPVLEETSGAASVGTKQTPRGENSAKTMRSSAMSRPTLGTTEDGSGGAAVEASHFVDDDEELRKVAQKAFGWRSNLVVVAGKGEDGTVVVEVGKNFRKLSAASQSKLTEAVLTEVKPLGYITVQVLETDSGVALTAGGLKVKFGEDARLLTREGRKLQKEIDAAQSNLAKEKAAATELGDKLASLTKSTERMNSEADRLLQVESSELEQLSVDATRLRDELGRADASVELLNKSQLALEGTQQYETAQTILEGEVKRAKAELERAEANRRALEQSLASAQKERAAALTSGEKLVDTSQRQAANLRQSAVSDATASRSEKLREAQKTLRQLQSQLDILQRTGEEDLAKLQKDLNARLEQQRKRSAVQIAEAKRQREASEREEERQRVQEERERQKLQDASARSTMEEPQGTDIEAQ